MQKSLLSFALFMATLTLAAALATGDVAAGSCSRGVRSKNSNTPVIMTFVNKSGEYRGVMWADFNGKLVSYANLNPGQSYTVNTFATHPWIFTDGPGNCVEMFVARAGTKSFTLKIKASGRGGD
jgi:hypothetical protein